MNGVSPSQAAPSFHRAAPMSTGKWKYKPLELTRAIEIVRKAGLAVTGVTISNKGDITVATGKPADDGNSPNPWDPPAQGSGR
jgi:hypothetical protein